MVKQLVFNFSNKTFYTLVTIGILIVVSVGVYAYTGFSDKPWHGGDSVVITIGGSEKTIQQAIDDGLLGSGTGSGLTDCYIDFAVMLPRTTSGNGQYYPTQSCSDSSYTSKGSVLVSADIVRISGDTVHTMTTVYAPLCCK